MENNPQKTKVTRDDRIKCSRVQYEQRQLGFAIRSHDDLSGRGSMEWERVGQKSESHIPEGHEHKELPLSPLNGTGILALLLKMGEVACRPAPRPQSPAPLSQTAFRGAGVRLQAGWRASSWPTPVRKGGTQDWAEVPKQPRGLVRSCRVLESERAFKLPPISAQRAPQALPRHCRRCPENGLHLGEAAPLVRGSSQRGTQVTAIRSQVSQRLEKGVPLRGQDTWRDDSTQHPFHCLSTSLSSATRWL